MISLLKLLPYIGIVAALAGGIGTCQCQRADRIQAEGERDVARQQVETARAELVTARQAFALQQRETLSAVDAGRACALEYATTVTRKDADIAAKTADAAHQRALLKKCSVQVPEILLERAGEVWKPRGDHRVPQ